MRTQEIIGVVVLNLTAPDPMLPMDLADLDLLIPVFMAPVLLDLNLLILAFLAPVHLDLLIQVFMAPVLLDLDLLIQDFMAPDLSAGTEMTIVKAAVPTNHF